EARLTKAGTTDSGVGCPAHPPLGTASFTNNKSSMTNAQFRTPARRRGSIEKWKLKICYLLFFRSGCIRANLKPCGLAHCEYPDGCSLTRDESNLRLCRLKFWRIPSICLRRRGLWPELRSTRINHRLRRRQRRPDGHAGQLGTGGGR